jgi:hypothetical protein
MKKLVGCLLLHALLCCAAAEDWPKGFAMFSESPDRHYGILVPTIQGWDGPRQEGNYVTDLQEHRSLGKISGSDYYVGMGHGGYLDVVWSPDSRWCVLECDERWGFSIISVIELKSAGRTGGPSRAGGPGRTGISAGATFVQTEIGQRVDKVLNAATTAQDANFKGYGSAFPRYRVDRRKVFVRVTSTTDPKDMSEGHGIYSYFQGTYDVRKKRWLEAKAQPISYETYESDELALGDVDKLLANIPYPTEEDKQEWFEESLNAAYAFARAVLPRARFAALKKEQIAWLHKRRAASTLKRKNALTHARIATLQAVLW